MTESFEHSLPIAGDSKELLPVGSPFLMPVLDPETAANRGGQMYTECTVESTPNSDRFDDTVRKVLDGKTQQVSACYAEGTNVY